MPLEPSVRFGPASPSRLIMVMPEDLAEAEGDDGQVVAATLAASAIR